MAESREIRTQADRIAEFGEWIGEQKRKNAGADWARATEEEKLGEMYWESCSVSDGLTIPGPALLAAIERNIDYAGLPSVQRDMLEGLRGRLDAGQFSGSPAENSDAVGAALSGIVDAGFFEKSLREARDSADQPWSDIPEDRKVWRIIGMALDSGAWASWEYDGLTPGGHVLATIEREVDYAKLSPWRREGLEKLRAQLDAGELDGESPISSDHGAGYALRRAELEADIENEKHFGATGQRPVVIPWAELTEEEKLGSIQRAVKYLSLRDDPKHLDVIGREVDLAAVPEWRRPTLDLAGEEQERGDWASNETPLSQPVKESGNPAGEIDAKPVHLVRGAGTGEGRKCNDQGGEAARLKQEWLKQVAFDRTVANLGRLWQEEMQDDSGKTWEELPADDKVAYLAEHAAERGMSFERFAAAAETTLGLASDSLTSDDVGRLLDLYRDSVDRYGYRPGQEGRPAGDAIANERDEFGAANANPHLFGDEPANDRKGEYQVWHDRGWPQSRFDQMLGGAPPSRFPQDYFHAADVQTESLQEAVQLTTSKGHVLKGDDQPRGGNPGVRSHTPKPFVPRDTDAGDVIVDPQGKAQRYDGCGFKEIKATARTHLTSPSAIAKGARSGGERTSSPGGITEGQDGTESPTPDRGNDRENGR